MTAALAVRGGLDRETAIKAITINAAEIIGASDRIGSVEVGKDADFSLFDGDPLDLAVTAKAVAVGGVMYRY